MQNMEVGYGTQHAQPQLIQNGFYNKNFKVNAEVSKSNPMKIYDFDSCDSSNMTIQPGVPETFLKHEKKPKSSRIWSFVSRRKVNSAHIKRPQSMILTGEIINPKPKLSFMDRVRSFKKMRASTFSNSNSAGGNSKNKGSIIPIEGKDENTQSAILRTEKLVGNQRPYRHSFAGYIDDSDSSLEDVELNICVSEYDANENRWLRDVHVGIDDKMDNFGTNTVLVGRGQACNLGYTKSSTIAEGEIQRRHLKIPPDHTKRRSSDVWTNMKGISLASKDHSKVVKQSVGTNYCNVESTTDNSSAFSNLDERGEENLSQAKKSNQTMKPRNFGGVLRFFSSVAEAARKWKSSSKPSQQEEHVPSVIAGGQAQEALSCKEPLVIENQSIRTASSISTSSQSPDSEVWVSPDPICPAVFQDLPQQSPHAEPLHCRLTAGAGCSSNSPFLETCCYTDLPPGLQDNQNSSSSASLLLQIATDQASELGNSDTTEDSSMPQQNSLASEDQDATTSCDSCHGSELNLSSMLPPGVEVKGQGKEQWMNERLSVPWERKGSDPAADDPSGQGPVLAESLSSEEESTAELPDGDSASSESRTHQGSSSSRRRSCQPLSEADDSAADSPNPLSCPPHPLTRAPSVRLDRCHSLPLSQSTPTGLDQLGWMKVRQLSTAAPDLGSKTLEVRRDGRKGRSKWKPTKPSDDQLPVHKVSSYGSSPGLLW
ncbi:uncharacterized protein LOC115094541 [Rhinatrema bivittatum]|uniref:uncharacterized protein LOC115094541 n=1 Tax=Rhinatrema bivittatum TaxID=194408 RepID=UPI0011295062|nr:uncharacterized protein LOC115094541 [Rhinatrema bivittatum]XP_029463555.1 uncharacterized protein LOC115094541 [Rhinatrema bivittatum]